MRVLHLISGSLNGGAGRGAYLLHKALNEQGIESSVLTDSMLTNGDPDVISLSKTIYHRVKNLALHQLDGMAALIYPKRKPVVFNTGFFGCHFTKQNIYKQADIIHLHYINGLVRMKDLRKIKKPIVWTLRDMWPMTGGCHTPLGCDRFKTGCGKCVQLGSNLDWDLSKFVIARKKKNLNKTTKLVGISSWIYKEAKESLLFKEHDVRLIHNNVSAEEFFPISKSLAKKILGISPDKKLVLTGSLDLYQSWKGFDLFENALKNINSNEFEIYLFGGKSKNILYKSFGLLHDTISLRIVYSAADVFVAPSRMDGFGKTLAEAMACGTPVVCFDATGPKDIVEHKRTGYKAVPFSTEDLAEGIKWVLNLNHEEYQNYCRQARERVLKYFDTRVIAKKYIELYKEMLTEQK